MNSRWRSKGKQTSMQTSRYPLVSGQMCFRESLSIIIIIIINRWKALTMGQFSAKNWSGVLMVQVHRIRVVVAIEHLRSGLMSLWNKWCRSGHQHEVVSPYLVAKAALTRQLSRPVLALVERCSNFTADFLGGEVWDFDVLPASQA